ncbi:8124_t:CDS:2, partial [Funneliformis geosporum]
DLKFIPYVAPKAPKEAVISTPALSSSSTSTSVSTNLDLEIVQEVFAKDRSKLLNSDEYLKDDDMEEDLKDFTIVTKATSFAVASNIKFTHKERTTAKLFLLSTMFLLNDDFKGVLVYRVNLTRSVIIYFAMSNAAAAALHMTIPDLKIDTFSNIQQVFTKYGTVTNFKMTVR